MRSSIERQAANDERRISFPDFPVEPESVYFVSCPKQGPEMQAVVLLRVGFSENCCPKQGQDFKPSAAPLYPNMGQVPPPPWAWVIVSCSGALDTLLLGGRAGSGGRGLVVGKEALRGTKILICGCGFKFFHP